MEDGTVHASRIHAGKQIGGRVSSVFCRVEPRHPVLWGLNSAVRMGVNYRLVVSSHWIHEFGWDEAVLAIIYPIIPCGANANPRYS